MDDNQNEPSVQLIDMEGRPYHVSRAHLIGAARQCIREKFSASAGLTSPQLAKNQIQVLIGDYEHEVFFALWLNSRHQVIRHDELFRGTVDSAAVYPREVVKAALACNAAAVIFAHNHPSGDPSPSQSDLAITRRLRDALTLIDVRTLDHLVVGRDVTSMAEFGLL